MILVKKYNFFLRFVSVKIRLQIMFSNVLWKKRNFYRPYKIQSLKVSKIAFFQRGQPTLLVKKGIFFLYLFSVKIRLEIMFNNVLRNKETFYGHRKFRLSKSQKSYFSKGVNPCFWSKNVIFFLYLFSVKIRLKIMINHFFYYKKENRPFNELKRVLRILQPTFK